MVLQFTLSSHGIVPCDVNPGLDYAVGLHRDYNDKRMPWPFFLEHRFKIIPAVEGCCPTLPRSRRPHSLYVSLYYSPPSSRNLSHQFFPLLAFSNSHVENIKWITSKNEGKKKPECLNGFSGQTITVLFYFLWTALPSRLRMDGFSTKQVWNWVGCIW